MSLNPGAEGAPRPSGQEHIQQAGPQSQEQVRRGGPSEAGNNLPRGRSEAPLGGQNTLFTGIVRPSSFRRDGVGPRIVPPLTPGFAGATNRERGAAGNEAQGAQPALPSSGGQPAGDGQGGASVEERVGGRPTRGARERITATALLSVLATTAGVSACGSQEQPGLTSKQYAIVTEAPPRDSAGHLDFTYPRYTPDAVVANPRRFADPTITVVNPNEFVPHVEHVDAVLEHVPADNVYFFPGNSVFKLQDHAGAGITAEGLSGDIHFENHNLPFVVPESTSSGVTEARSIKRLVVEGKPVTLVAAVDTAADPAFKRDFEEHGDPSSSVLDINPFTPKIGVDGQQPPGWPNFSLGYGLTPDARVGDTGPYGDTLSAEWYLLNRSGPPSEARNNDYRNTYGDYVQYFGYGSSLNAGAKTKP